MKHILLIDTSMKGLVALHRSMRREPWLIVTCTEPINPRDFDAVVTAWIGVGKSMVAQCKAAKIPVVIYTGAIINDIPEDIGVPVVFKPTPIDELLDVVRFAMGEMEPIELVEGAAS